MFIAVASLVCSASSLDYVTKAACTGLKVDKIHVPYAVYYSFLFRHQIFFLGKRDEFELLQPLISARGGKAE